MKKKSDDTLVSVLIECGIVDQQAILGALAERNGGDDWLADRLVERGIVAREDMTEAVALLGRLREDDPFKAQRARVDMVKLRMRRLGHAHEANAAACNAIKKQSERVSSELPMLMKMGGVAGGD